MESKIINDVDSFTKFKASLVTARLPHEDLNMDDHLLIGYYEGKILIGTGGLEIYGQFGLLRSVSVEKNYQGKKLGTRIVMQLIDQARNKGLEGIYLLTETAGNFFLKNGFEVIDRNQVVPEIKTATEFTHVCPAAAICMYLHLSVI